MNAQLHHETDSYGTEYWLLSMVGDPETVLEHFHLIKDMKISTFKLGRISQRMRGYERSLEVTTHDPDTAMILKLKYHNR